MTSNAEGAKGTEKRVLALMAWPSRRRPATWRCVPARAGWSRRHREECLCADGVAFQRRLVTWREYLLVQGGAEGTDERVLALRTMRCRVREEYFLEEGHDVVRRRQLW